MGNGGAAHRIGIAGPALRQLGGVPTGASSGRPDPPGCSCQLKSTHGLVSVELLEPANLAVGEAELDGSDGVVEMVELGGADDRRGDHGLMQQPGQGKRTRRPSPDLASPVPSVSDGNDLH